MRHPSSILFAIALTLTFLTACSGSQTIRKTGLSYLAIGDSMPRPGTTTLEGHSLSESETSQGGYAWRVATLDYPEGKVMVESDFANQTTVNRIRVETPDLKLPGGLRVGQTYGDMRRKSDAWRARPFPEYRVIEMTSPKYPRRVFLLQQAGFNYRQDPETMELSDLSDTARLVAIVVM